MGMKLSQLVSILNSIIERSNRSLEDIEIVIDTKEPVMTVGARPCTGVKSVSMGFDWEAGQLRITPENDLMCVKHNCPQKVLEWRGMFFCPKCECALSDSKSKAIKYCMKCGTAVKWDE